MPQIDNLDIPQPLESDNSEQGIHDTAIGIAITYAGSRSLVVAGYVHGDEDEMQVVHIFVNAGDKAEGQLVIKSTKTLTDKDDLTYEQAGFEGDSEMEPGTVLTKIMAFLGASDKTNS